MNKDIKKKLITVSALAAATTIVSWGYLIQPNKNDNKAKIVEDLEKLKNDAKDFRDKFSKPKDENIIDELNKIIENVDKGIQDKDNLSSKELEIILNKNKNEFDKIKNERNQLISDLLGKFEGLLAKINEYKNTLDNEKYPNVISNLQSLSDNVKNTIIDIKNSKPINNNDIEKLNDKYNDYSKQFVQNQYDKLQIDLNNVLAEKARLVSSDSFNSNNDNNFKEEFKALLNKIEVDTNELTDAINALPSRDKIDNNGLLSMKDNINKLENKIAISWLEKEKIESENELLTLQNNNEIVKPLPTSDQEQWDNFYTNASENAFLNEPDKQNVENTKKQLQDFIKKYKNKLDQLKLKKNLHDENKNKLKPLIDELKNDPNHKYDKIVELLDPVYTIANNAVLNPDASNKDINDTLELIKEKIKQANSLKELIDNPDVIRLNNKIILLISATERFRDFNLDIPGKEYIKDEFSASLEDVRNAFIENKSVDEKWNKYIDLENKLLKARDINNKHNSLLDEVGSLNNKINDFRYLLLSKTDSVYNPIKEKIDGLLTKIGKKNNLNKEELDALINELKLAIPSIEKDILRAEVNLIKEKLNSDINAIETKIDNNLDIRDIAYRMELNKKLDAIKNNLADTDDINADAQKFKSYIEDIKEYDKDLDLYIQMKRTRINNLLTNSIKETYEIISKNTLRNANNIVEYNKLLDIFNKAILVNNKQPHEVTEAEINAAKEELSNQLKMFVDTENSKTDIDREILIAKFYKEVEKIREIANGIKYNVHKKRVSSSVESYINSGLSVINDPNSTLTEIAMEIKNIIKFENITLNNEKLLLDIRTNFLYDSNKELHENFNEIESIYGNKEINRIYKDSSFLTSFLLENEFREYHTDVSNLISTNPKIIFNKDFYNNTNFDSIDYNTLLLKNQSNALEARYNLDRLLLMKKLEQLTINELDKTHTYFESITPNLLPIRVDELEDIQNFGIGLFNSTRNPNPNNIFEFYKNWATQNTKVNLLINKQQLNVPKRNGRFNIVKSDYEQSRILEKVLVIQTNMVQEMEKHYLKVAENSEAGISLNDKINNLVYQNPNIVIDPGYILMTFLGYWKEQDNKNSDLTVLTERINIFGSFIDEWMQNVFANEAIYKWDSSFYSVIADKLNKLKATILNLNNDNNLTLENKREEFHNLINNFTETAINFWNIFAPLTVAEEYIKFFEWNFKQANDKEIYASLIEEYQPILNEYKSLDFSNEDINVKDRLDSFINNISLNIIQFSLKKRNIEIDYWNRVYDEKMNIINSVNVDKWTKYFNNKQLPKVELQELWSWNTNNDLWLSRFRAEIVTQYANFVTKFKEYTDNFDYETKILEINEEIRSIIYKKWYKFGVWTRGRHIGSEALRTEIMKIVALFPENIEEWNKLNDRKALLVAIEGLYDYADNHFDDKTMDKLTEISESFYDFSDIKHPLVKMIYILLNEQLNYKFFILNYDEYIELTDQDVYKIYNNETLKVYSQLMVQIENLIDEIKEEGEIGNDKPQLKIYNINLLKIMDSIEIQYHNWQKKLLNFELKGNDEKRLRVWVALLQSELNKARLNKLLN